MGGVGGLGGVGGGMGGGDGGGGGEGGEGGEGGGKGGGEQVGPDSCVAQNADWAGTAGVRAEKAKSCC